MKTLAILLIILGVVIADISRRGRLEHFTEDLSDAFLALVTQDADEFGAVLTRKSDEDIAAEKWATDTGKLTGETLTDVVGKVKQGGLAAECVRLGEAAKGYRWTATGPDYYDCSGLVWRGSKNLGFYGGPRFTTSTIQLVKAFERVKGAPSVGDVVVWPTHHMGVVTGADQFYSAKSRRSGIGYAKISTWGQGAPVYYRPRVVK